MRDDAPILHEGMFTTGVEPRPDKPSNVAKRVEFALGDVAAGFRKADVVVEREFTTKAVHQGYIEPHAVVATTSEDGQSQLWSSSQGHFLIRASCAKLLGIEISQLRVFPAEIGGGFGGKINPYLEPVALVLSRKTGRPVKMVMTREEVFRATGPTSGGALKVKVGATKDGKITAAEATLMYEAGAFAGSPVHLGCMTGFAPYEIENVKTVGYDVVSNRPKCCAYRAPGAPIAAYGIESVLDEVAKRLNRDPVEFRLENTAREGTKAAYGPQFGVIGFAEVLRAVKDHPHYTAPLGPNQGRGVAAGFWFNGAGQASAAVNVNEDGTVVVTYGNPDIGGTRASMTQIAAEVLGHRLRQDSPRRRRHQLDRLQRHHGRQQDHVLRRPRRPRGGEGRGRPASRSGGEDVGHRRRRRGLGERRGTARQQQRRRIRSAVARRHRGHGGQDGRSHQRSRLAYRHRPRPEFGGPHLRRRGWTPKRVA